MRLLIAGTGASGLFASLAYNPMAKAIGANVIPLHAMGLAHTRHSVDKLCQRLEAQPEPVDLIGHSQGGLVAALAASRMPERVRSVIAICAPFGGTRLAHTLIPIPAVRCMSPGAKILADVVPHLKMSTIVASKDGSVVPYTSGIIDGVPNYTFARGHIDIIFDSEMIALVRELLDDDTCWDGESGTPSSVPTLMRSRYLSVSR